MVIGPCLMMTFLICVVGAVGYGSWKLTSRIESFGVSVVFVISQGNVVLKNGGI